MIEVENITEGAQNLLCNCAQLQDGESLLIVQEDPELGWYDYEVVKVVIEEAKRMNISITIYKTGHPTNDPDHLLETLREKNDCTLFFSRIGDQDRFLKPTKNRRSIMCYARNIEMLASPFARTEHLAMLSLKKAVDNCYFNATEVEISCPLGSNYSGTLPKTNERKTEDVNVLRFPIGIHTPIDAEYFSGSIVLSEYLTNTACKVYEPPYLAITSPVFAELKGENIIGFKGESTDVQNIENHYQHIAKQFDLNPFVVNSWHAGIHYGCSYDEVISEAPDRWGNQIFMHPSNLHFHSCCDDSNGQICWNIVNPTIKLDGIKLWENGELRLNNFSDTKTCLERWPELAKESLA